LLDQAGTLLFERLLGRVRIVLSVDERQPTRRIFSFLQVDDGNLYSSSVGRSEPSHLRPSGWIVPFPGGISVGRRWVLHWDRGRYRAVTGAHLEAVEHD
jgi:hypothetical protein